MAQKLRAIMIIEVAGRPAEHVSETLKKHVGQMNTFKNIEVISENYSEPKKIDEEKEIYTCFSEVEIETENLSRLIEIIFAFMPSHIEIIEPSELSLGLSQATLLLNELAERLHRYDEIAKIAQLQNHQLALKLQEMQNKKENAGKSTKKSSGKIKKQSQRKRKNRTKSS